MRVSYASVLVLAALPVTAQEPVRAGDANLYSLEKERALGRQLADEIRKTTTELNSHSVQEYVDRVGRQIAARMQGARFDYTFAVIADETSRTTHEPIALPGGAIFIPAALFLAVNDEPEFAGMLAHAMAHVALRHGTGRVKANESGSIPLIFMGGWLPRAEGQAFPLAYLDQLRSNETEADSAAVESLARAGYDPAALVRYIERVRRASPPSPGISPKISSPLPDRDRQIASLRAAIERLQKSSYAEPGTEFAAVRDEVVRLTARPPLNRGRPTLRRDK